ncbi:MAG: hypothetical protein Roseis2KO_07130 [Roseivirga sp.]
MSKENAINFVLDLGEVALDSIMENEILEAIPVLGSVHKSFKIGHSISDALLLRKLKTFLDELDNQSTEEKKEMIYEIENQKGYADKIGLQLIEFLNRCDDHDKPQLIAVLFKAYIMSKIDLDRFLKYASIISNVFIGDLEKFCFLSTVKGPKNKSDVSSLLSAGLLEINSKAIGKAEALGGIGRRNDISYEPNEYGYELIELIKMSKLYESWVIKENPQH